MEIFRSKKVSCDVVGPMLKMEQYFVGREMLNRNKIWFGSGHKIINSFCAIPRFRSTLAFELRAIKQLQFFRSFSSLFLSELGPRRFLQGDYCESRNKIMKIHNAKWCFLSLNHFMDRSILLEKVFSPEDRAECLHICLKWTQRYWVSFDSNWGTVWDEMCPRFVDRDQTLRREAIGMFLESGNSTRKSQLGRVWLHIN